MAQQTYTRVTNQETGTSIEQIEQQFIREHWTAGSGITAVSIGRDDSGQPCLRVSLLDEDSKAKLPNPYVSQHGDVTVLVTVAGAPMLPRKDELSEE